MRSVRVAGVLVLLASCGGGSGGHDASGTGGTSRDAATGSGGAAGGATGRGGSNGGTAGANPGRGGMSGGTSGGGRGGGGGTGGGTGGRVSCPAAASPTCAFSACGGDLTGTWTIDAGCYAASHLVWVAFLGCDNVQVTKSTVTASGTWTFKSDLTFTRTETEQMTLDFNEPISCDSSAAACGDVRVQDYAATCTGTGCCSCTQVRPASTVTDSGTYTVSGSTVTVTPTGGNALPYQFCVNGNTLALSVQAGSSLTAHR